MRGSKKISFATMMVSAQRRHAAQQAAQPVTVKPLATTAKLKPVKAPARTVDAVVPVRSAPERRADSRTPVPAVAWLQLT